MPQSSDPLAQFRLEHRHPTLPTTILGCVARLKDAAWALEDARRHLASDGAQGTLAIVLDVGGQEIAVIEQSIRRW